MIVLQKTPGTTPTKVIQDVPGWRLLGLTIFEEREGPIKVSDLLREQGIHLTEEDMVELRKLEENSEEVPEIETLRELPNYWDLQQVWIKKGEFYVSTKTGEVFGQRADLADYETGVTRITGGYKEEILRAFNEIRSWMDGVKNRGDLAGRLRSSFSSLRKSGILPIRDQGYSQYPAHEGKLIAELEKEGRKGYVYLSRPMDGQRLDVCYGATGEAKEFFWPSPNFLVRDVVNQVTQSFQDNGVPHKFRGDVYEPIEIPLGGIK